MSTVTPKFPDVVVQLTGVDGNAFVLISVVTSALRRAGKSDIEIKEFTDEAFASVSYDALVQFLMKTVEVR